MSMANLPFQTASGDNQATLELAAVATEIGEENGFDLDYVNCEAVVRCELAALMAGLRYCVLVVSRRVDGGCRRALEDCSMAEVATVLAATILLVMLVAGHPILSRTFLERTNSYYPSREMIARCELAALIATPRLNPLL